LSQVGSELESSGLSERYNISGIMGKEKRFAVGFLEAAEMTTLPLDGVVVVPGIS
jgi:hypothetical protein